MRTIETGTRVTLKNILFLTDFSGPSEAALPFALSVARAYQSKLYALHVITPQSYETGYTYATPEIMLGAMEAFEELMLEGMRRVDSEMTGLPHETIMPHDVAVMPALEKVLAENKIDLIVLGTHGRTGALKLLMGSVAEEIFRQSPVPVLTIGPHLRSGIHGAAQFRRVLFATDFSKESLAALPYATSLAQENQARLTLLHVVTAPHRNGSHESVKQSAASLLGDLHDLIPKEAELWCHPEAVLEYGPPGESIIQAAKQYAADLIVLGVRDASHHVGAATHMGRATAHQVVAHAECPVLTVRG